MAAFDHNHIVAIRKQKIAAEKQRVRVAARAEVMCEEMAKFRARLLKAGESPDAADCIVTAFEVANVGAARSALKKEIAAYFKNKKGGAAVVE